MRVSAWHAALEVGTMRLTNENLRALWLLALVECAANRGYMVCDVEEVLVRIITAKLDYEE